MTLETLQRAKLIESTIKDCELKMRRLSSEASKIEDDKVGHNENIEMSFVHSNIMYVNTRRLHDFLMSEYDEYCKVRDALQKELKEL